TKSTPSAIAFGRALFKESSARAINDRGQGKRPNRLRLDSSMATITMSSGGRSNPRCRISQSRALISRPGTRQTIHKARVADSKAIATAQTVPLSLDKIAGFPFRQKIGEWGIKNGEKILLPTSHFLFFV